MRFSERVKQTNQNCATWLSAQRNSIEQRFKCPRQNYAWMDTDAVKDLAMATGCGMAYLVTEVGFGSMTVPHLVITSFDENVFPYLLQPSETETN